MAKKEEKPARAPVEWSKIGQWVFLIGILVAIIASFIAIPYLTIILIVGGLVIGLLNITAKEVHEFLTTTIALLLVGTAGLGVVAFAGAFIESVLKNIVVLVAPAALVVALKSIWALAKAP